MTEIVSDESIVSSVQSGDVDGFGILVQRYETKMLRYVKRFLFGSEDSEDLVQEVFLKAFTNIQSIDTKRKFSSWLYRVAHNECINALKKKKRDPLPFFDPETLFPQPVSETSTDDLVQENELKKVMGKFLQKLDNKHREPLILYYYEELSYKEIADILRIPSATVGVRIKRAKDKMKKIYDSEGK